MFHVVPLMGLIRFARVRSHEEDFNTRNKCLSIGQTKSCDSKIVGFVRILCLQDRSLVSPRLSTRFML